VGIPLGSISAVKQNSVFDRICMMLALVGISVPGFWVAMMLVVVFAVNLGWLPAYGIGGIQNYILPVIAGSLGCLANQARMSRSSMLEVVRSDFVVTARAKGLSESKILIKHILPNGLVPVVQTLGNDFGGALAGAIVIENVFAIPGMGTYLTVGVSNRDYPVVLGVVVFLALIFSLVMLVVDIAFCFIDPRIKAQYEGQSIRLKRIRRA
jgi:peptide/nickel transport system permease protein